MVKSKPAVKIYKRREGLIIAANTADTAVVKVPFIKLSAKYGKRFTRERHYHAQNPDNKFGVGERVIIEECRPLSRLKRWRVIGLKTKV